jgi:sugar lactone lactonase YvrE
MKLISAAAAMLLAVNASESIKMPLNKRKAMKSLKKHDSIVQDLAQTYSKDITWAPDYIGHVWVGTPGQQQDIVFDSGSGMLILATQNCTQCSPVANS